MTDEPITDTDAEEIPNIGKRQRAKKIRAYWQSIAEIDFYDQHIDQPIDLAFADGSRKPARVILRDYTPTSLLCETKDGQQILIYKKAIAVVTTPKGEQSA